MENVLEGKTLVAIGDSLFAGNRLGNEKTWVNLLGKKYHMRVFNFGENENTVAVPGCETEHIPMCMRYQDVPKDADYVVILGGANDKRLNVPIGELTMGNRTCTSFVGALNTLLAGVTERCPRARILLMTNYNRRPQPNRLGLSDIDYVDAMLKVAALWSLPCFDNYRNCGVSFQNPAHLAWIDEGISLGRKANYHFSAEAYRWLMQRYERILELL